MELVIFKQSVCALAPTQTHTHTHTHIYIYIYIIKFIHNNLDPSPTLYFLKKKNVKLFF